MRGVRKSSKRHRFAFIRIKHAYNFIQLFAIDPLSSSELKVLENELLQNVNLAEQNFCIICSHGVKSSLSKCNFCKKLVCGKY